MLTANAEETQHGDNPSMLSDGTAAVRLRRILPGCYMVGAYLDCFVPLYLSK